MSKNPINSWLQNYNSRHQFEYNNCARIVLLGDGTGWISYNDEVIPGTSFENLDDLENILLNE